MKQTAPLFTRPAAVLAVLNLLLGLTGYSQAQVDMEIVLPPEPVTVRSGTELRRVSKRARPGQVIRINPGVYRLNFVLSDIHGKPGRPITLTAADPRNPPVFKPTVGDGLKLSNVSHIQLQDLVIRGGGENGLNIDDGQTFDTPSHHVTLRRLTCSAPIGGGNRDAIKLSGVHHLNITDCVIQNWADGGSGIDIVRCKEGVITNSLFTCAPGRGHTGLQIKGASENFRVVNNRFENAGTRAVQIGGATGVKYVPGDTIPYEARGIVVEGNTFTGGGAAVAFVSCDGGTFRYNTVLEPTKYFMRILQENRSPHCVQAHGGVIERNLIVYRTVKLRQVINIGGNTKPQTFTFNENFWYAADQPDRSRPQLPAAETGGVYGQNPDLVRDDHGIKADADSPAADYGAHAWPDK